ncbi:hypothetical protein K443DRAFT_366575 [Laccaria amethystina LaAM-08-1]|uniref:Uncharacterized protein n=1 Tax=Laccaria amethystina LaAM-08-1 TaxID=1095629 RepID=A0A0C9XJC5_9AGAR|nr:hypothetical protein K443DRAFT_366575 [Laccaria amethystina LaAM-08-1]
MLSLIFKMPHICEYGCFSDIEKCIESQLGSPEVFVNEANPKLLEWYARGQDTGDGESVQNVETVEPLQSIESGETRQSVDNRESRESIESGEPRQTIESSEPRRSVESSEPRQNLLESRHSRQGVHKGELSKESRQGINRQKSQRNVQSLCERPKNDGNGGSLQNVSHQNVRSGDSLHQNVEREKSDQGVKNFWHRFSDFWIGICCCA